MGRRSKTVVENTNYLLCSCAGCRLRLLVRLHHRSHCHQLSICKADASERGPSPKEGLRRSHSRAVVRGANACNAADKRCGRGFAEASWFFMDWLRLLSGIEDLRQRFELGKASQRRAAGNKAKVIQLLQIHVQTGECSAVNCSRCKAAESDLWRI